MTVEHTFQLPGHTSLHCDRDFGVIEKKKRKTAAVYNTEGWFTLVEKARLKNTFQVVRMAQKENFVDIAPMRERLTFRGTAVDRTKVNLQKAMRIKISKKRPGKMFIVYKHNAGEAWQEDNIGQRGTVGDIHLKKQYSARCPITSAKSKDPRNLCSNIPVKYRGFYTGLQATIPSPRKLRVRFSYFETSCCFHCDVENNSVFFFVLYGRTYSP